MAVNVPILKFITIVGIPYLMLSGIQSHKQYLELYSEIKAIQVLLKSKEHYDEEQAKSIRGIITEDE